MAVDWLESEVTPVNDTGELVYSLDKARASGNEVRKLGNEGWLVIRRVDEPIVEFAVFSFSYSDADGASTMMKCVFHGSGPSGSLRECRHTWWGDDDGYVFYPEGLLITAALKELSEFFDDLA